MIDKRSIYESVDNMDFIRQWKIVNVEKIPSITIIGAGSIGSWLTVNLAKLGAQDISVYDPDTVESQNGPNQIYRVAEEKSDMGRLKVEALEEITYELSGIKIKAIPERYKGCRSRLVISGVDSMKSREEIYEDYIYLNTSVERYWDARMGGEHCSMFCVDPSDIDHAKWYRKTLFSDEDAVELPCGERSVGYNTRWIADFVVNQIKSYVMGQDFFETVDFSWKPYMFSGRTSGRKYYTTVVKG